MGKPNQYIVTINKQKFCISRQMQSAINAEQKAAHAEMDKKKEELKRKSKELSEKTFSGRTMLMEVQAKINQGGKIYWYEYIPHPSIEKDAEATAEHLHRCFNIILESWSSNNRKMFLDLMNIKEEDIDEDIAA